MANISSPGLNSLYEINNLHYSFANLVSTVDSNASKPHNIAVDFLNNKLYLTHSGTNDVVSVYDTTKELKLLGTIRLEPIPLALALLANNWLQAWGESYSPFSLIFFIIY